MFQVGNRENVMWSGIEIKDIHFGKVAPNPELPPVLEARSAFGRAIIVDQAQCEVKLYPFYDVINANFGTNRTQGVSPIPGMVNLGVSVQNFIESISNKSPYNQFVKDCKYDVDIPRCICASNALQTNFVLSNGFIICNGELVCKPERYDAAGLDCHKFINLDGTYTTLVFDPQPPQIIQVTFNNGQIIQPAKLPKTAQYGPVLVKDGANVSDTITYERIPTKSEQVNFPPDTTRTSFTAFGIHEDKRLILVSMFEELRGRGIGVNLGITLDEIAELLVNELGAEHAILGGGGADTQQFIKGDQPQYMVAPIRTRSTGQGERAEVRGARGLGVIIAILAKQEQG